MLVTLMPNAKIMLDLTLVPAKRDSQEMEKHALVRLNYITVYYYLRLLSLKKTSSFFEKKNIFMFRPSFDFNNIAFKGTLNFCQMIRKIA